MTTAVAIQTSVTQLSIGIVAGSIIEAFMPAYSSSSSSAMLMFEAFVQVALNGVLVSQVGGALGDGDPTFGLPFSLALFEAQPGLKQRIDLLAVAMNQKVSEYGRKMVPRAPEEASPTPEN